MIYPSILITIALVWLIDTSNVLSRFPAAVSLPDFDIVPYLIPVALFPVMWFLLSLQSQRHDNLLGSWLRQISSNRGSAAWLDWLIAAAVLICAMGAVG